MTAQNISSLINAAVAAKMTPEFIEKEIDARIGKLVVETIDRAFRSYGDLHKQIENAVTESIKVDPLDLPSYGAMVTAMLKTQIEATVAPVIAGRLAEDMEALLKLAPKEIKLSEIAKEMMEWHKLSGDQVWGDCITVIVEHSDRYSTKWLYLDSEKHYSVREKYNSRFSVLLKEDGTISSVSSGDHNKTFVPEKQIGRSYGLEQRLRAYVACNTKIILDEDEVVTSAGDD
jgi:hypothetical protein